MLELHQERIGPEVHSFKSEVGAVTRLPPETLPDLRVLGCPSVCETVCELESGIILVLGPSGSGRSCTLAAMLAQVNAVANRRIFTVESPIEFVHANGRSTVTQYEVEPTTTAYIRTLRELRSAAPDIVMVADLSEPQVLNEALTLAREGCLVLGAALANSVSRYLYLASHQSPIGSDAAAQAMADLLRFAIGQRLVLGVHGDRILAHEVLVNRPALASLIAQNSPMLWSAMQMDRSIGGQMYLLDQHLRELLDSGKITVAEARRHCVNPEADWIVGPAS